MRQQLPILRVTLTPRSDCSYPLFVQGTAKLVVKVQTWDAFLCKRPARTSPGPPRRPPALQLRTRVLNDSLADDFRRWHPGFTHVPDRQVLAA